MDKEQLLQYYFSGTLNTEQERYFKELIETDKDFKEQFDFERDLQFAIRDKERKNLKQELQSFEADIKNNATTTPKNSFKNWTVAASIILILGLGWWGYMNVYNKNYSDMFVDNFEPYPNTVFPITRGDTIQSLEREGFAAYESENFQTALDKFQKINEDNKKPSLIFYKAQCYIELNRINEAEKILKENVNTGTTFIPESHWYLALIYLKLENKESAVQQLQILITRYNYNKEKANELLKELE